MRFLISLCTGLVISIESPSYFGTHTVVLNASRADLIWRKIWWHQNRHKLLCVYFRIHISWSHPKPDLKRKAWLLWFVMLFKVLNRLFVFHNCAAIPCRFFCEKMTPREGVWSTTKHLKISLARAIGSVFDWCFPVLYFLWNCCVECIDLLWKLKMTVKLQLFMWNYHFIVV